MSPLDWLSPEEWQAVRLSLSVAGRSVAFGLPVAVFVAYLLSRRRFLGRPLLDAVVHLPLVMPPVVVGWGLLLLFGVRGPVGARGAACAWCSPVPARRWRPR